MKFLFIIFDWILFKKLFNTIFPEYLIQKIIQ